MFLLKIITFFVVWGFFQEKAHKILLKTIALGFQFYFEKVMII